ncbi:MAG: energy transducer TonB [Sphingomonadales bacterium]|nr:energy transducer TonB [Sphingomonadales bacterium]
MKLAVTAVVAASLAASTFVASPTRADAPIIVQSQRISQPAWVSSVSTQLSRNLDSALFAQNSAYHDGIVAITFTAAPDGQPGNMVLARRSGDSALDRVAMNSVRRLRNLHPLPELVSDQQRFRAYLIVASDQKSYEDYARLAQREEAQRQLAERADSRVIALTIVGHQG